MSKTKIIFKNAMLITILIGGFFFLSKLFGQENNPYIRFLNIVFVIVGIRQAVKTSIENNNETNYATNYGIAFGTSALGVIFSTIGVLILKGVFSFNCITNLMGKEKAKIFCWFYKRKTFFARNVFLAS